MNHAMKYCQARLSVATLDQIASAALYTVGPEYFAAVRDEYKKRRDTLCRKLGEIPGVVFDVPGGAFRRWPRCRSTMPTSSSNGCSRNSATTARP